MIFACLLAAAVDGDTLRCVNIDQANGRVRLARIDAPEMDDPAGEPAKQFLAAQLTGAVECEQVDASPFADGFQETDRYGRIVANCRVASRDLSATMLAAGHAARWPHERG